MQKEKNKQLQWPNMFLKAAKRTKYKYVFDKNHLSPRKGPSCRSHFGVHRPNAVISTHKMATSSNNCPTRLRVA